MKIDKLFSYMLYSVLFGLPLFFIYEHVTQPREILDLRNSQNLKVEINCFSGTEFCDRVTKNEQIFKKDRFHKIKKNISLKDMHKAKINFCGIEFASTPIQFVSLVDENGLEVKLFSAQNNNEGWHFKHLPVCSSEDEQLLKKVLDLL